MTQHAATTDVQGVLPPRVRFISPLLLLAAAFGVSACADDDTATPSDAGVDEADVQPVPDRDAGDGADAERIRTPFSAANSLPDDDPRKRGEQLWLFSSWNTGVLSSMPPADFLTGLMESEPEVFGDQFAAFAAAAAAAGQKVLATGSAGEGIRVTDRVLAADGQRLTLAHAGTTTTVHLPLAGAFQADNALVAAGLCIAAGEAPAEVFAALEHLKGAPGRLQRVGARTGGGEAYVDYAHTPDGLETVLKALRPHTEGRLLVVFGAGGDRDRTKRPLMGEIAARLADVAIITDDNPRSEEPAAIRAEVQTGAPGALNIGGRREAIRAGVAMLTAGDVLVVAGKGHEQGQTIAGVTHPFDDVVETAAALGLEPAHV